MTIGGWKPDLLRRTFEIARSARSRGNHPFGALLADPDGRILLEAENTVVTERDPTGHAETNLVRKAGRTISPERLATATLYTSTEPCAMCSGAIFWSGIPRVVFGLSGRGLIEIVGTDQPNVLDMPAVDVFEKGGRRVAAAGPFLVGEAAEVHAGFWVSTPPR